MDILKERILAEGRNLGNGILKIDSILNHQVDPALMMEIGKAIAERFADATITRVLTAEVSGIAPALNTAWVLQVPLVWARKNRPVTMKQPVFVESAPSHTKGGTVNLMVSPEFINEQDRILIVDDFLASGKTLHALGRLVHNAGADLVGIACVVEKSFEGGRAFLEDLGTRIESLVCIAGMEDGGIQFTTCDNEDIGRP